MRNPATSDLWGIFEGKRYTAKQEEARKNAEMQAQLEAQGLGATALEKAKLAYDTKELESSAKNKTYLYTALVVIVLITIIGAVVIKSK